MKKLSPCVCVCMSSLLFLLLLCLSASSLSLSLLSIEVNHQLYILENHSLFYSLSSMQPLTPNDDAQRPIWCLVIS